MIITITKGIDDEIEFKGFKGRYFYMIAIILISILLLTFILYAIGVTSFFLILFSFLLAIGAIMYVRFTMEKLGKYGHIQEKHISKPKFIINDEPFYKIVK